MMAENFVVVFFSVFVKFFSPKNTVCKFCANSWQSLNGTIFKIKVKGVEKEKFI